MKNKEEILEERLKIKKEELKQRQENFEILFINEKDSSCYERNAINELLVMMQLKDEIKELEFGLQLK